MREALHHFLAIPVIDGVVVEDHVDAGQPGQRNRAKTLQVRDAVHDDLDGNRNLLLNFLRRPSRPLGNDRDVVVGDVRIGLNRKIMEGNRSPNQQQNGRREHQEAVAERKID